MLKGGADVDATDAQDRTALQLTGYPNNAKKCAKVLKAHAAMAGSKDFGKRSKDLHLNRDESPFMSAPRQSRPEAIQRIDASEPTVSQSVCAASVDTVRTSDAFFDLLRTEIAPGKSTVQFSWLDAEQRLRFEGQRVRVEDEERRLQAALLEAAGLVLDPASNRSTLDDKVQEPVKLTHYEVHGEVDRDLDEEQDLSSIRPSSAQLPVEVIELAPPVVKWLDRADQPGREMLLSRLSRLMRGHRSYALSKRLQNTRYDVLQKP